jgi:cysteinyl-tRNA synthetase
MGWESPWGKGFPGWHIECSAMINATLGKQIDIHTGGIDLMPTHHNNEIAQSESAIGKRPLSRFWLHHEFLNLKDEKISKSLGNMINLSALIEQGVHPVAYRYFLLGAHYRSSLSFSFEALDASQNAFLKLRRYVDSLKNVEIGTPPQEYQKRWYERLNDDLDTPGALAVLWEMLRDEKELSKEDLKAGLLDIDRVLGLGLDKEDAKAEALWSKLFGALVEDDAIPERVKALLEAREAARKERDWHRADSLRKEIEMLDYTIEDTPTGARLFRR